MALTLDLRQQDYWGKALAIRLALAEGLGFDFNRFAKGQRPGSLAIYQAVGPDLK